MNSFKMVSIVVVLDFATAKRALRNKGLKQRCWGLKNSAQQKLHYYDYQQLKRIKGLKDVHRIASMKQQLIVGEHIP